MAGGDKNDSKKKQYVAEGVGLTRAILALALRAASLRCAVQIGNPADLSNPGAFVHAPPLRGKKIGTLRVPIFLPGGAGSRGQTRLRCH